MKVLLAFIFASYSLASLAAQSIVRCDLHRQGFDEYSYVTYFQPSGANTALQIVKGSGIYSYYKLPAPKVEVTNGDFISHVYGMDGNVSLKTSDKVLTDPAGTHFGGVAESEGGDEAIICYLLKPQQVRRFKDFLR